ncbi:hypothetical protein Dcar01_03805 [Deinococcus carri]|uniref:Uncharacterized protein n=1 Tax=Deinococcus carri TaxID=1211323 RepID=A0ABP9WCI4_9DEIO
MTTNSASCGRLPVWVGLVTADLPVVFFGWRRFDLQAEAFTYTPSLGATPVVVEF